MPAKKDKEISTKEKIFAAAFHLFAKKGLSEVSMREIAQASGVTKPVIYYYFKDKEELCCKMIEEMLKTQTAKIEKLLAKKASLYDFLIMLFEDFMNDVKRKDVPLFVLQLHSYISSRPKILCKLKKIKEEQCKLKHKIFNEEIRRGNLQKEQREIINHLVQGLVANLIMHAGDSYVKFKNSYPRDMARAVLRAVGYKGEIK